MSKKEEALRRAVLSRDGNHDRGLGTGSRHRVAQVLTLASVFAGTGLGHQRSFDPNAERGRFSGGDFHPDKCSCAKCAAWRKAGRHR